MMNQRRLSRKRILLSATICNCLGLAAASVDAANATWTKLTPTATYNWNDNANWNAAFPNAPGERARFDVNFATVMTVNVEQAISIGRMDIGDNTSNFRGITYAAGTAGVLTFDATTGNAILNKNSTASTQADVISAPIVLNDNIDITNNAVSAPISVTGAISELSGPRNLTKLGNGTLSLSGANSYTGPTTVSAGILIVASPSVLYGGLAGWNSSNIIVNAGAMLDLPYNNGFSQSDVVTITGLNGFASGSFLGLNTTAGNATLTPNLSHANVVLTKSGTNTLTIVPSATNTIKTAVQSGTLALTNRNNLFAGNSTNWTAANFGVSTGATLAVNVGGPGEFTSSDVATLSGVGTTTGGFLANSTLAIDTTNAGGFFSQSDAITDAGPNALGITKTGSGTLSLKTANTHSGATMLASGELVLAHANALQNSAFGNTGGTLTFSTVDQSSAPITSFKFGALSGSTNIPMANDTAGAIDIILGDRGATFSGTLSGNGNLIKNGTGSQVLSGTNTFTGTTTINAGRIVYSSIASISGNTGTDVTVNSGGIAAISTAIDQNFINRINPASTGVVALTTVDSPIALDFSAPGLGAVSFGSVGNRTYSGTITPHNNIYRLGGGNNSTLTVAASLDDDIVSSSPRSLVLDVNGTGALSEVLLNQQSTFSGGTTLQSGVLVFGANSTPTAGTVTSGPIGTGSLVLHGGVISTNPVTVATTRSIANEIVVNGTVKVNGAGGSGSAQRNAMDLTGKITGNGTFSVDSQTVTAVTYNGNVNISGDISGFTGIWEHFAYDNLSGGTTSSSPVGRLQFNRILASTSDPNYGPTVGVQDFSTQRFVTHGAVNYSSDAGSVRVGDTISTSFTTSLIKVGELSGDGGSFIPLSGAATGFNRNVLEVGHRNTSTSYAGGIRDGIYVDLVKVGTGSLTLSGMNSYTGTTTVRSGSLILARDAVNTNLTFQGTKYSNDGIFNNVVTVNGTTDFFTYASTNADGETVGAIEEVQNGQLVNINLGGTAPGGVSGSAEYYVINASGSGTSRTFQISTTLNGAPVDVGTTAPSTMRVMRVMRVSALGTTFTPVELGDTGTAAGHLATGLSETVSLLTGAAITIERPINVNNVGAGSTIGGSTDHNSTFSGAITLAKNVNLISAASGLSSVTISGVVSGTGFGINKIGTGNATLSASNTYTGNTTVSAGTLNITGNHTTGANYSVASGASLNTKNVRVTNALTVDGTATITANGGTAGASKVETLTIGASGKLNLKDNDLVVGTAPNFNAVRTAIIAGKTNNAASGITSDVTGFGVSRGFGYAMGNDPKVSSLLAGSLAGQTFDTDSVLVKFTLLGDADLDGDTDLNDLGLWSNGYTGDLGANPPAPTTFWTGGDFDYDGDTDLNDLGLWSSTYTGDFNGGPGSLFVNAPNASPEAVAILNSMGFTVVPEPSTFVLAGVGLAGLAIAYRQRKLAAKQD